MTELLKPRVNVASLDPYDPGHYSVKVDLSANESPYDLPKDLKAEFLDIVEGTSFNRYPDHLAVDLRSIIAEQNQVAVENVIIGNGGDELILDLLLAYGGDGRVSVSFEPTFAMYAILSKLTNTRCVRLNRDFAFSLPDSAAQSIKSAGADIVFIAGPNNPSGNPIPAIQMRSLLDDRHRLVLVDEAYCEFNKFSFVDLLLEYRNLVILRTFSKAFSLAGLRVGYMLAAGEVISNLLKVKLPYNVNALSQAAAAFVLRNRSRLEPTINEIINERERVYTALKETEGLVAFPSSSNFILIKTRRPAKEIWRYLLDQGIFIRFFNNSKGLENCLRITIGSREENDMVITALRGIKRG